MTDFNPATVSDLIYAIKNLIEEDFQEVLVQGEVSNFSIASSGHCYFTLSDADSALSCAFFKMDVFRNPLAKKIKDGDKIVVLGPVTVYPKKGQFQLIVKKIIPAGEGLLKLRFEQLKAKLSQEGIFDLEHKKKIPLFPKKIALITSETGAAIQDFINVLKRRSLWFEVVIIPTLVQGEKAPKSLIESLHKASSLNPAPDVIVITRGGGSIEDLWAFNDEMLVREIFKSTIPVVSAVGHQIDFTLCDYVADFRAETPTAAAETISQAQTEIGNRMKFCRSNLERSLINFYQNLTLKIQKFHPKEVLSIISSRVQNFKMKVLTLRLFDKGNELIGINDYNRELDDLLLRHKFSMDLRFKSFSEKTLKLDHLLQVLNPNNTLKRGYTYIRKKDKNLVTSFGEFKELQEHETFEIIFSDGSGFSRKDSV